MAHILANYKMGLMVNSTLSRLTDENNESGGIQNEAAIQDSIHCCFTPSTTSHHCNSGSWRAIWGDQQCGLPLGSR